MITCKVDFKDVDSSPALTDAVQEQADKLEKYFDRITSCHVVISHPHRNHNHGNTFHVSIVLHIPGQEIVVNREPETNTNHEDPYQAVRDAFKAAKRQLQDYVQKMRRDVKHHDNKGTSITAETVED
jgi:ribosomal subunit interface protein